MAFYSDVSMRSQKLSAEHPNPTPIPPHPPVCILKMQACTMFNTILFSRDNCGLDNGFSTAI